MIKFKDDETIIEFAVCDNCGGVYSGKYTMGYVTIQSFRCSNSITFNLGGGVIIPARSFFYNVRDNKPKIKYMLVQTDQCIFCVSDAITELLGAENDKLRN